MDVVKNILFEYGNIMDQEVVGVQLGCYSVALIGLAAAVRKVRPFSRFKQPKDIPKLFINEKRELTGYVKRIDPSGVLLVEHKPLISVPLIPRGELPVKILGVKLSGLGISWLQSIVVNSEVTFIPVKKEVDSVHCEIFLQNTKITKKESPKNEQSNIIKRLLRKKEDPFLNVGECLVKIGFAEITPTELPILKEKQCAKYYQTLLSAQTFASKKKLGMKYYLDHCQALMIVVVIKSVQFSKQILARVVRTMNNVSPKMIPT